MPTLTPSSRRALLSVSEKRGLIAFATQLKALGYEILATGGTERALTEAKIPVTSVEGVTGFPECFGGRVKTLHPLILGGILFRRDHEEDRKEATKLGIQPIDLVCVNLYPFEQTKHIEQIDIGGPTLLRSAAKNAAWVTVVTDPDDYERIAAAIENSGDTSPELRQELAAKTFLHTAQYDAAIATHFSAGAVSPLLLTQGRTLRYGENPHQWGKFFALGSAGSPLVWKQLQGKEMSYLNILDADAAWELVQEFSSPAAVMIKHANPCGVAVAETAEDAFQRAYDADKLSAFGVIVALNRACAASIAEKIIRQKMFVEVLIAPSCTPEAIALLTQKPNLRLLIMSGEKPHATLYRSALGGMLVQERDVSDVRAESLTCVTKRRPSDAELRDLLFAWKVVKHAKSNAIVLAKSGVTVGIGAGQTSRVESVAIAARRAGEKARGSALASDAFFPFSDSLEEAAKHGVTSVIQPGGSIRDAEVIQKADELGLAMVCTGVRAFWH